MNKRMKPGMLVTLSKYGWRSTKSDEHYKLKNKVGLLVEINDDSEGGIMSTQAIWYNVLTTEGNLLGYNRKDLKLFSGKS